MVEGLAFYGPVAVTLLKIGEDDVGACGGCRRPLLRFGQRKDLKEQRSGDQVRNYSHWDNLFPLRCAVLRN